RDAFRRRGFASAMMAHALEDARAAGLRTAVLQAAPDGVGVYRRLGFAEFGTIREYKPPPGVSPEQLNSRRRTACLLAEAADVRCWSRAQTSPDDGCPDLSKREGGSEL